MKRVSDFQSNMLAHIDPARAGADLMTDVRARYAAALERTGIAAGERSQRIDAFDRELVNVNATDTAAAMIDRTILRPAIAAIDQQFKDQPVVDAQLRESLAFLYQAIGLFDAATPLRESALATRRRALGDDHPDTLDSISGMGNLLLAQARPAQSEPFLREALERKRRVLGDTHRATLSAIGDLGSLLRAQGKFADAEPFFRETLDKRRRSLGDDDPDTLLAINILGYLLLAQGKPDEAAPLYREALDRRRRIPGEDHRDTLFSLNNLGTLLSTQGRPAEAEQWYREVLERRRRALGEEHPDTIISINNLAFALQAQNKLPEATAWYREGYEKARRVHDEQHPMTVALATQLGRLLQQQGKNDEAIALLAATEPAARKVFRGASADRLAMLLTALGRARIDLGYDAERFKLAEANLIEARQLLTTLRGPDHVDTRGAAQSLVQFYKSWEQSDPGHGHAAKGNAIEAELRGAASTQRAATTQPVP